MIVVAYKTENNVGAFNKKISLQSNTGNINLFVKGKVEIRTEANFGKKPDIYFPKTTYDFGVIREEDGYATAVFEFINTGTADLLIVDVRSSCGCLTTDWSKTTPIAPGEKGVVKGYYNQTGRPGKFQKSLTVSTNAIGESSVIVLSLIGETLPKKRDETY